MADDDMLSQAEIDSLLKGVSGEDEPAEAEQTATGKRIRPFDPATQQRVVRGRLHTLDIINERFARDFRMSLFNLIRRSADITVDSVKIQAYSEFTRNLPVPANINLFGMKPLRGNALMVFPPNMVFLVVDSLFGGDGRFLTKSEGREFTHTEQRIIGRLLTLALESYDQGWRNVYPLEMEFQRAEMQVRFANITSSPNELVVNTTFHLEVGAFGADFNICIPYAMIEPIREVLTNTALQKADPEEQEARAQRLAGEVKRSHVPLTADFTTIESTIGRVSRLAVGDVLPIELPGEVTARVDDVPVFAAAYGRLNGRKALRVTRMIDHGTQDSPRTRKP
ncbi:flagellar motor switch protein FliM [Salinisphaera hydrothermalis]|uniref:Flagellar motor switch protein FliM n=1 Tax=Salinisphaera hydrothermalis (strain C41B8) TaxID=1304275 RepID=A0A084IMT5_SALHC|nr:flagellar motor switch protein FliM [Salinisphaera hydrothermalis]KEZ78019.1 flagellar motor switch protein [Salinisphaera hydrothermalis C41B8]